MKVQYAIISFIFGLIFLLLPWCCYSQEQPKDSLVAIWENTTMADSTRANSYIKFITKYYYKSKTDSAYAMALMLKDFAEERQLKKQNADVLILLGNIEHIFGDNTKASKNFGNSLKIYEELNDKRGRAKALNGLGSSYRKVFNLDEAKLYFEKSLAIGRELKDTYIISQSLVSIGNIYGWRFKSDKAIEYYNESIALAKAEKDSYTEALGLVNLSNAYIQKKDYKQSRIHIEEAIKIGDSIENYNILANAYSVLCLNLLKQKDYDNLIEASNQSLIYAEHISNKDVIDSAYYYLFEAYKGKRNFDLTIKYLSLSRDSRTNLDDVSSTQALEKIKIDNNRTQDSLVNINNTLKLEITHDKEKSNLVLAWGGSLSALSVLTFIVFRNSKRKQRKAEREHKQQIRDKEKLLKDFELSTIDAMIAGQEKERQRIAADLHDSVGATLAAAKLQFEYLVKHQIDKDTSGDLIQKISGLLDNAYNETRSMSHLKNSGVMAKYGLLPAVEKLAKNASNFKKLEFEVQSFGLDQRIENALEISIFRIIQELVTNVIKHAKATHAVIYLTNNDNNLNIMIEDNGVGFNPKQVSKNPNGLGITSIDKRVEHMDGHFKIESEVGKGTTVIIDIPV